uniref:Uncharacterized protein n=1 Tax=Aegilops tauschii subsp. strangulata TaxID=200361 RepID=A0A453LNJ4_AEGTS
MQMAKLEGGSKDVDEAMERWHNRSLAHRLYDAFTVAGLRVEAVEPGHLLCSFMVPPRLTSVRSPSHGRARGSSVCRSVQYKIVYTCVCTSGEIEERQQPHAWRRGGVAGGPGGVCGDLRRRLAGDWGLAGYQRLLPGRRPCKRTIRLYVFPRFIYSYNLPCEL